MDASLIGQYKHINTWAPYILQIAIGIHAVFEGLAIGITKKEWECIALTLAIVCHKWAEGKGKFVN